MDCVFEQDQLEQSEAGRRTAFYLFLNGEKVPYHKPVQGPLLQERTEKLLCNGVNFPVLESSERRLSNAYCYDKSLYDLPTPVSIEVGAKETSVKHSCKKQKVSVDFEFPADLELSFHSGSLNSISSVIPKKKVEFKRLDSAVEKAYHKSTSYHCDRPRVKTSHAIVPGSGSSSREE